MDDGWLIIGGLIALVLALIALTFGIVAFVAVPISKHYAAATCHSFGDRTNREVRFVKYTYWSWDCLTPSSDGKWISTDRLWEETPGQ